MNDSTTTLAVGLVGVLATLVVGLLGSYFTAQARSNPLQQALFTKQIDLLSKIALQHSRLRVFLTLLQGPDDTFFEQAREDTRHQFVELAKLEEEAAVVLPVELWVAIRELNNHLSELIQEFDDKSAIGEEGFKTMVAMMAKVALISRAVLGVDELTGKSLDLFSSQKEFQRLAKIEVDYFERIYEKNKLDKPIA